MNFNASAAPIFEVESPDQLLLNTPVVVALGNAYKLFEKTGQDLNNFNVHIAERKKENGEDENGVNTIGIAFTRSCLRGRRGSATPASWGGRLRTSPPRPRAKYSGARKPIVAPGTGVWLERRCACLDSVLSILQRRKNENELKPSKLMVWRRRRLRQPVKMQGSSGLQLANYKLVLAEESDDYSASWVAKGKPQGHRGALPGPARTQPADREARRPDPPEAARVESTASSKDSTCLLKSSSSAHDMWRKGAGGAPAGLVGQDRQLRLCRARPRGSLSSPQRPSPAPVSPPPASSRAGWSACQFTGCSFTQCDFGGISITGCTFINCSFTRANFDGGSISTSTFARVSGTTSASRAATGTTSGC